MEENDTHGPLSGEIQGNILRGYRVKHARFVLVGFQSPEAGRQWLGALPVTSAAATDRPACAVTVALTHRGLGALGVRADLLALFPEAFRAGMSKRRDHLGDLGDEGEWDAVFRHASSLHALVGLYVENDDLVPMEDRLAELAGHPGVVVLDTQEAQGLDGREHFGFRDGISQPVRGDGSDGWKSDVPIREFLLFESNWNGGSAGAASDLGLELARLGTYLVYRKLEQHVEVFRRFVKGWILNPDHVAAKIMGRWTNGTPVTEAPLTPGAPPDDENDFDYSDDTSGAKCPFGAHIARANPRRRLPAGTADHRLLRRGVPYGKPVAGIAPDSSFDAPVPDDDHVDRGLIFVALNASIERQFEFLQKQWINEPNFNTLDGADPIAHTRIGEAMGNFRLRPNGSPRPLDDFVTLRGGEYFFVPSMKALAGLAEGVFSQPSQ